MAKIRIKASAEDVEQAASGGDFEEPKPGIYTAELVECEPGYTKGEDGQPDKDRPYLKCVYKITGEGREGKKPSANFSRQFDYVSFTEGSKWKVAQFAVAMGLPQKQDGSIDGHIENEANKPGTVIGRKVLLRVKSDKDLDGNYRGKPGWVGPIDAGTKSETSSVFDDTDEKEEEASDPFEDEGDGDKEDGEDLLTEDDLANMDNKELGATAKEFDIDPKDFIVKNSKGKKEADRAGLIAAILEAQGAEGEGDDEDPF